MHLSSGIELGPTKSVDLDPGERTNVALLATAQPFGGWTPHAEVGVGEHGAEGESRDNTQPEGNQERKSGESNQYDDDDRERGLKDTQAEKIGTNNVVSGCVTQSTQEADWL